MAFVLLWAQMNFEQMTALFRVEERAVAFTVRDARQPRHHRRGHGRSSSSSSTGARPASSRATSRARSSVYAALLVYRHGQLGLTLDRPLLRQMNRFGLPLVPSMLALWMLNFGDRFFILKLADASEVGVYSIGVPHRIGDGAAPDGVPCSLARVRVLDRGRRARARGRTRTCSRISSSSRPGRPSRWACSRRGSWSGLRRRLLRRVRRRRVARLRCRRLRRLHRRLRRPRPDEAHAVQLGSDGQRSGRQRHPQPPAHPAPTGSSAPPSPTSAPSR